MEWKKLISLIMLASWFTSAVYSNTVYISTTANSSCSHCLTISQFANGFSGHHEPNITAVLLPGNHILKENLVIRNVLFFSIVAVDRERKKEEDTCLSCAEDASITFQSTTNVKVSNITFIGCRATKIKNVERFTLKESIFKSFDDSPGSGLIVIESSIVILRTSFLNLIGSVWNSSSICRHAEMCPVEVGGAIIGLRSTVVIFDSVFEGVKAELGGAIYTESSYLVIINCNFFGPTRACKYLCIGGAIFSDKSSVVISMCNFVGNKFNRVSYDNVSTSITKGGALGFIESFILINWTNLFDNDAYIGGGLCTLISFVFIDNTCFMQNSAFLTGAGMNTDISYIRINNSNFILNLASMKGTLSAVLSYINVSNSTFYSNTAGIKAGAIQTTNCTIIIFLSMIVNNTAIVSNGGGIEAICNSTAVIERTIIKDNIAGKSGGGIKIHHDSKLIFLDKVVVKNNTAWYGAAIHVHFTLLKSSGMLIVTNNSATLGSFVLLYSAGEFMESHTFILENNTGSLLVFNSHIRGHSQGEFRITHNKLRNFTTDPKIQEGSGLSCILGRADLTGKILIEHNSALNGGAILAITSGVVLDGDIILRGNSATDTGGAVYAYHSDVKMRGRIQIEKNVATQKGGGIHSVSSSLALIHDDYPGASITYLYFVSNSAKLGGGICLEVSSTMYLITRERLVHFVGNRADYGGAIYIADETNNGTCASNLDSITAASESECFFQSITPKSHLITINKLFSFSNNIAKYSGSILYGGLLDRCTVNAMTKRHIRYSSLPGFMENIRNYTNSDAVRVCFCQDSIADCNYQPKPI
jgi:predicted outer membrane repeat protein